MCILYRKHHNACMYIDRPIYKWYSRWLFLGSKLATVRPNRKLDTQRRSRPTSEEITQYNIVPVYCWVKDSDLCCIPYIYVIEMLMMRCSFHIGIYYISSGVRRMELYGRECAQIWMWCASVCICFWGQPRYVEDVLGICQLLWCIVIFKWHRCSNVECSSQGLNV